MTTFCLVTGANKGIGRALAHHFSSKAVGWKVIAVGRSKDALDTMRSEASNPENILVCEADCSSETGRNVIVEATTGFVKEHGLKYLIHNAGTLGAVTRVEKVTMDTWRTAMGVNVEAPFFLTQQLLPLFAKGARVLQVSSGAAYSPLVGWSTYNVTKAAALMVYKCMSLELMEKGIAVGSFKPGVVDTDMQVEIRSSNPEDFPKLEHFEGLKVNAPDTAAGPHPPPSGGLDSAENVAHFAKFLLTDTKDDEFSAQDWDIRSAEHFSRWH